METDPYWMITLKRDGEAKQSFIDWIRERRANHDMQVISAVAKEEYMEAQRQVGAAGELTIIEIKFLAAEKEAARVKG